MSSTLRTLSARYPRREFSLIIGADNWVRFPQWHEARWIMEHYPLIVFPRPGYPIGALPQGVHRAATPLLDISSTHIRECLPQPGYNGEGLAPQVWEQIRAKGYYGASSAHPMP